MNRRVVGRPWTLIAGVGVLAGALLILDALDLFRETRAALQWTPGEAPSTESVPAGVVETGHPILSLALDPADLYDPDRGILAHVEEHGAEWERPGSISYFEDGRVRFAADVGVRIHGGSSRSKNPRQGFRFYFRREYGATQVPPGILFEPDAQPIRRLVAHNDVRWDADGTEWHLVNPFAYDIAAAVGAIAPDTKPVRFFVNGEEYGVFVLTERLDERYFQAHWGHGGISLSQEEFDAFWAWVSSTRPLRMADVETRADLDNLTRWFLSVAVAGTRDAYQGPGQLRDTTRDVGAWFWMNWDMDQSFRDWDLDSYQYLLERVAEDRRGRNPAEPRPTIVTSLLAEDPAYRLAFRRVYQQMLNHEVTQDFLDERLRYYQNEAGRLGVTDLAYMAPLTRFVARRLDFFRRATAQWLNAPSSYPAVVLVPDGHVVTADGVPVTGRYAGRYFADIPIALGVPASERAAFEGWRVDGTLHPDAGWAPIAAGPLVVEATFTGTTVEPGMREAAEAWVRGASEDMTTPEVAESVDLRWVAIPAGRFRMGCVPGDVRCEAVEQPRREVDMPRPFDMLAYEVTAADFAAYASATGSESPRQPTWFAGPEHPVMNVTWDEAQGFCTWAGGRLPTEAEWEYAARGGRDGLMFENGDTPVGAANYQGTDGPDEWTFTAPVGQFAPNGYGLYDMAGNLWEWTADVYAPMATPQWDVRAVRGGSWDNEPPRLRVSQRAGLSRLGRHNMYVGFRCVRSGAE